MARAREEPARPHHHERGVAMPGKRSRTHDAVRVRYRRTKSLPRAEVLRLYRSVQWSAARKPDRRMRALGRSHSVVTARLKRSLVAPGTALSSGALAACYPQPMLL